LNAVVDPYIAGFIGELGLLSLHMSSSCGLNYWERCSVNRWHVLMTFSMYDPASYLDPEDGGSMFLW